MLRRLLRRVGLAADGPDDAVGASIGPGDACGQRLHGARTPSPPIFSVRRLFAKRMAAMTEEIGQSFRAKGKAWMAGANPTALTSTACPGRSAARALFARSGALQTRDRRERRICRGPGSAVHHSRKRARAAPHPGHANDSA